MSYYHPSTMAPERVQHIEDMLQHPMLSQCRPIGPDRSTFDLPLHLQEGRSTILRVSLSPHFPQERPTLIVLAPIQHPSVDSSGRVLTPGVAQWNYPFSRLVTVVLEAFQALSGMAPDFRAHPSSMQPHSPPQLLPPGHPASMPMSMLPPSSSPSPPPNPSPPRHRARTAAIPPPHPGEIATLVRAEVQGKSAAELQKMVEGDTPELKALLTAVIRKSQVAAAVEAAREEVRGAAQANLRLEGALAEARTQVAVVRSSELDHHKEGCAALAARQQAVVAALGPQRVVAALEDALSTAEHKGEGLKEQMRAGELQLDRFLDAYVATRKEYNLLTLKREAADRLLPPI